MTPPVSCEGFYPTNEAAQKMGSYVTTSDAKSCAQQVGGNTFGWCSCSDSVPRMVNPETAITTCDKVCSSVPSTYTSDIPALQGTPASSSISTYDTDRLNKLIGALGAFLMGGGLLVFHVLDQKNRVGEEKALVELVRATGVAPSAK